MKRYILLLYLVSNSFAQIFPMPNAIASGGSPINLGPVTSSQAVISYTAPSSSACTVEVSESNTYSSVVNDVNSVLYSGSDSDFRTGAIHSGTHRLFVVGTRTTQLALDGNNYSRSLQANTLHYWRACGGGVGLQGTFTTMNIPVGMTLNEPPQVSNSVAGGWVEPTFNSRGQVVYDPQTGAKLVSVSIDGDDTGSMSGSTGITIGDGAGYNACNTNLQDDGTGVFGYVCNLDEQVGVQVQYFFVPNTGEVRYLGINYAGGPIYEDLNAYQYDSGTGITYRLPYIGGFTSVPQRTTTPLGSATIYGTVDASTLMHNFDSSFNVTDFVCGGTPIAVAGQYTGVMCRRSIQDSYGWFGTFYGGDGRVVPSSCAMGDLQCPRIVAAWNTYNGGNPTAAFCGLHEVAYVPDAPGVIAANWHSLDLASTVIGAAADVALTVGSASSGTSTITVNGPLTSQSSPSDPNPPPPTLAGTRIAFVGFGTGYIIQSVVGNVWTLTTPLNDTIPDGTKVWATCNIPPGVDGVWAITYWDSLNDTHGTDITKTYIVPDTRFPGGGHYDTGPLGRVSEAGIGYGGFPIGSGTLMQSLNQTAIDYDSSASYNGIFTPGYGNALTRHPSYKQTTNTPFFMDMVAFAGANAGFYSQLPGAMLKSGQIYQYLSDNTFPLNNNSRKKVPTQASSGGKSLKDISGPGAMLDPTSGGNYTYCTAYLAEECYAGSLAGETYFNVPTLTYLYCSGGDQPNSRNVDICITNTPSYATSAMQWYYGSSTGQTLARSRKITGGLAGVKLQFNYPLFKSLANTSWGLFTIGQSFSSSDPERINVWASKLPVLPSPDGIDRTQYIANVKHIITPVGMGIATATIEFGYAEYGNLTYCTSRAETCVSVSGTILSDPFKYKDSDSYSKISCVSSCDIVIPTHPQHTVYYQVKFYTGSDVFVVNGDTGVIAESHAVE